MDMYLVAVSLFLCCLVMSKRKNRLILCHRQIKYHYILSIIKIFRFFCQKEKDLLPIFHNISEGLALYSRLTLRFASTSVICFQGKFLFHMHYIERVGISSCLSFVVDPCSITQKLLVLEILHGCGCILPSCYGLAATLVLCFQGKFLRV